MSDKGLLKRVGDLSQVAGIRQFELKDGKGKGTGFFEVYNRAGLRFTVAADKCLDIYDFSYRGVNFSFQAKTGCVGNQHFNALDNEFVYYWNAGMMFTCGLANVGPACVDNGLYRTEHGRIGMIPAQNICSRSFWLDDDYVLAISGEMTESMVYGSSLRLKRDIQTSIDSKQVFIRDTVENLEPASEELMYMYHFNFGYPLLDDGATVVKPKGTVTPRIPEYEPGISGCMKADLPADSGDEQVFFHSNKADKDGFAYVGIINSKLMLGAFLKYSQKTLPVLVQWKSMRSHDYTMGLEPSNSFVRGRSLEREAGGLQVIPGYGKLNYEVALGVLDGKEEIDDFVDFINEL